MNEYSKLTIDQLVTLIEAKNKKIAELEKAQTYIPLSGQAEQCVMRLRRFNEWRRGADIEQPDPKTIGLDIDYAIDIIERMSKAIKTTIDENLHLADGDDCTLKHN